MRRSSLLIGVLGLTLIFVASACARPAPDGDVPAVPPATNAPAPARYAVVSVRQWKADAEPLAWSAVTHLVYYDAANRAGLYNAYSARANGSGVRCLTCTQPVMGAAGTQTQRGVSDISPNGKWVLYTIENDTAVAQPGESAARPGDGYANDLWLSNAAGTRFWPLTSGAGLNLSDLTSQNDGAIWARFDRTGREIVWSQMTHVASIAEGLGQWKMKVADLTWKAGTPHLTRVRTILPQAGRFYEPYEFTADDRHIIFASDLDQPAWWDSQIWSVDVNGKGLRQLSPVRPSVFFQDYDEFAFPIPGSKSLIFGSTYNNDRDGIDYWTMGDQGQSPARLTSFNVPGSAEYADAYRQTLSLAFDPCNPDQFLTAVGTRLGSGTINADLVTMRGPARPLAACRRR